MTKTTMTRNWVDEAFAIANGDMNIKPKRDHITCLVRLFQIQDHRTKMLGQMMDAAYRETAAKRKAQGLPPVPPPPGLMELRKSMGMK